MPDCRHCGKRWPEGYAMCPEDGQPLGVIAAGSTIATSPGGAVAQLAPELSEDLPPGSLAGEYQIEIKIGQGGMGSVYGARHPLIGKRAAIKVISRELSASADGVDRFVREAQVVNQIGHDNIVDVFGFGKLPDGRSFFVMEWLTGESLRKRLERPIAFLETIEILETIAKALQAAHEAGVLHRDLKPDNIFLEAVKGEAPRVKLLDFGLAKLTSAGDVGLDRTRTGVVMGTPLYLSPEQAKGLKVDSATDVYSLGAMAFEMLTGMVPFRADSAVEIMALHISQPPPPLSAVAPHVPVEIDRLVTGMLMKHPRARPTAAVVRGALAAARVMPGANAIGPPPATIPASSPWTPPPPMPMPHATPIPMATPLPTPTPSAPPTTHAPAKSSRRWLLAGLAIVVGIAGIVLLAMAKSDSSRSPPSDQTKLEVAMPAHVDDAPTATLEPKVAPPDAATPAQVAPQDAATIPVKVEATAAVAKPGKLSITIAGPTSSSLLVDGRPAGTRTNVAFVIALLAGDHVLLVQANGYKPARKTVHVDAGVTHDVKLTLEARKTLNDAPDPFKD